MTAEIALLNRSALAFAADSAVTISDGRKTKIYNSAEKIFEFSRKTPVGLMLFNNMEFLGVPLDVLIRSYRREHDKTYDTCESAANDFIKHLADYQRADTDEDSHLFAVCASELREVATETREKLPKALSQVDETLQTPPKIKEFFRQIVSEVVAARKAEFEKHPLEGFLPDVNLEVFRNRYGSVVGEAIDAEFKGFNFDEALRDCVMGLILSMVKSKLFSEYCTGLVFGGFGEKEDFPCLVATEIDGVYFNTLKMKMTKNFKVNRRNQEEHASIFPFAQSEMAERFLNGIDFHFEKSIKEYVGQTIGTAIDGLVPDLSADVPTQTAIRENAVQEITNLLGNLKRKSRLEVLDMVNFMPKQELAYTAEALVMLTSIKRRVSAQQETVGGPIDVAILTRNEGFVWIKRKHYFQPELNSGYMARNFKAGGAS